MSRDQVASRAFLVPRMRMRVGVLLLMLGGVGAITLAATPSFFPANAERGRTLAAACLVCHAAPNIATGTPSIHPPKLAGQRAESIFMALLAYQRGDRKSEVMGPIAIGLKLQDLRDLGAYLAAEGPVRPPTPQGAGSWAQDRVHRDCTACHGQTGMGEMWGIPVIAGQHQDYLILALMAYRNGSRKDPTMRQIAERLSEDEINKLAEYFAMQSHLRLSE